jgi:CRP-like cAMP-binding protein
MIRSSNPSTPLPASEPIAKAASSSWRRSDAFYLILAGEVKVVTQGADGGNSSSPFSGQGTFSEKCLFDGQPRSASVVTTEDATFQSLQAGIPRSGETFSPILFKFLITLCQRFRESDKKLRDLALLDVPHRVCKAW